MNSEPPQMNNQEPEKDRVPGIVWVMLALSPAILIMLLMGGIFRGSPNGAQSEIITLCITDLAITLFASFQLLAHPSRTMAARIAGAILLGLFFAVLNMGIGVFAGCALSMQHM